MIMVKDLEIKFGERLILQNASFFLGNGKKIGVVGQNGCGKSTLFRVLTNNETYTDGHIDVQHETIGYIPQEFTFPDEMVGEYLEKFLESSWDFYKIEMYAEQVEFTNFDIYQPLTTLSEGQKMKVKLIETMLQDATILFIDEPTNHLDIEGILWFEQYVKYLNTTVVMISHDRSFLNHTVDEIWEIDKCELFLFVGDYDNYKEQKLKLIDKWNQEYVMFLKKKAQLEVLLENVHKIKDGKKRGRAVQAAKARIDRELNADKKEKYVSKKVSLMEFNTDAHQKKLMLSVEKLEKHYGEKLIFKDLSFELRGKDKLWLLGPNGAGKSTLVKIIMSEEEITSGSVKLGHNVKIGYFSQVQKQLNLENIALEEFIVKTKCFHAEAYGYLKKFLFDKDALKKQVKFFSPGERARFAFSIFAYFDYDLLILDEPDNHLDIETKEVMETSLREFKGAILLVSHDRYFVESVGVDQVLNLKEGVLSYY